MYWISIKNYFYIAIQEFSEFSCWNNSPIEGERPVKLIMLDITYNETLLILSNLLPVFFGIIYSTTYKIFTPVIIFTLKHFLIYIDYLTTVFTFSEIIVLFSLLLFSTIWKSFTRNYSFTEINENCKQNKIVLMGSYLIIHKTIFNVLRL